MEWIHIEVQFCIEFYFSRLSVGLFVSSATLAGNGLALGEEADFEALNFLPALSLIRSTKLHLITEPAFLPNACYGLPFYSFFILKSPVIGNCFVILSS